MTAEQGDRRGPYKLNDFTRDRVIQALRAGNYQEHAAAFAGISAPTYFRWMSEGRRALEKEQAGETLAPDEQQYLDFYRECEEARAQAVIRNVSLISQAAQGGQWQAAAWWLERTMPQQFARRTMAELSGPNQGPIEVSVSSDELNTLIRDLLEQTSDDSAG